MRLTLQDVDALRARKSELSTAIRSADARRREVQKSLIGATGADKAGLEKRLGVLDTRIARLEQDIDENTGMLSSLEAMRSTVGSSGFPHWGPDTGNRIENNTMPLAMMFLLLVMTPLSLAISRLFWRRGSRGVSAAMHPDPTPRLERMEQAIESIAIEIERVSEGQRFVTRLMAGTPSSAPLGAVPVGVAAPQAAERR